MSKCKYKFKNKDKFNGKEYCTLHNELCEDLSFACDKNCQIYEDYKQLEDLKNKISYQFNNYWHKIEQNNNKLVIAIAEIRDYCSKFQRDLGQTDMLCIEIINRIDEVLKCLK